MSYNTCKNGLHPGCLTRRIVSIGIIIALAALFGCAAPSAPRYIRDGKVYGTVKGAFRHRWWNYYERGLSFTEGQFYEEAATDFMEAIGQRKKDQRMARTYGMHFIDYFPHRELGIVYYRTRDLEAAKRELELSLNQYSSSKAHFYLDRVRRELIKQSGEAVTSPALNLSFKRGEVWTREDPVIVAGVANDNHYISGITIGKIPLFLEGSRKRVDFRKTLSLSQGRHVVEVAATNLLGRVAKQNVTIHVDRVGPTISIAEIQHEPEHPIKGIMISGSVYDDSGVSELSIGGRLVSFQGQTEAIFNERVIPVKSELALIARDRLGNRTSARIPIDNSNIQNSTFKIQHPIWLACANNNIGDFYLAGLFGPKDTRAPRISLKGWTDTQTVFLEKIYLEGEASDESKIIRLSVNRIPVLRREGRHIFFSHLADLREGENEIFVEAEDASGNRAARKISVTRQVPKALQLEQRLSLTVLPFEQKGEISESSVSFQDNLVNSLVNQNRFRVVEREKLDAVLQEQKLSRTKLIDRSTALKLGRLIAARSIITGSIIETRIGIEIVSRFIDTETSEILATEDVYDEIKDIKTLKSMAEGLATKFHREFPLLDGLVIQQKGSSIFTDLGRDKVKVQRRLIVYREEPIKHPKTGKVLGTDNEILGRVRITQVMPDLSKAKIIDGKASAIKVLDKVITE